MKRPNIQCPYCQGTTRICLPESLWDTLKLVESSETAEAIHKKLKGRDYMTVNAINNRLEKLRALDLVTRERQGKTFHYFLK